MAFVIDPYGGIPKPPGVDAAAGAVSPTAPSLVPAAAGAGVGTQPSWPSAPPPTSAAAPVAPPSPADPGPAAGLGPAPTASASGAANDPFAGDPGVIGAQNNAASINDQIDAWLKNASQQALIRFGDSALAGEAGFGGDPQAAAFAQQNYLSGNADLARADHANQLARRAIINRLAAHGILGSGDLGYQEGEQGRAYGNQVYDLRSTLLNYLQGIRQQALTQHTGAQAGVTSAYEQAYQNAIRNYFTSLAAWVSQQQTAQAA